MNIDIERLIKRSQELANELAKDAAKWRRRFKILAYIEFTVAAAMAVFYVILLIQLSYVAALFGATWGIYMICGVRDWRTARWAFDARMGAREEVLDQKSKLEALKRDIDKGGIPE